MGLLRASMARKQSLIMVLCSTITLFLACTAFVVNDILYITVGLSLLSLLVSWGFLLRLQNRIAVPVRNLARIARQIARDKNYSIRVTRRERDEVGELSEAFNQMLVQIQERDSALMVARDQLERGAAERTRELANSLSLINATLESTMDGIIVAREGAALKFNSKLLEMWNVPKDIMKQEGDRDPVLAYVTNQLKDPPAFLAKIQYLYQNPHIKSTDILELKDGRFFERYSQSQYIDGQYVGRIWSFRDITEQKRAEGATKARLEMQERFEKFAAAVPGAIYTFRITTENKLEFVYGGAQLEQMFGLDMKELKKNPSVFYDRVHPADLARAIGSMIECSRKMSYRRVEYRVNHPTLGEIWVEAHSMPQRDEDGSTLWHGFVSNVTERKLTEAKVAALNRQLIDTSHQAGMAEVATGVLHNVGNVLNSVNVSATLVADAIQNSKVTNLDRLAELLGEHEEKIGEFLSNDARGRQIPNFVQQLAVQMRKERATNLHELAQLRKHIDHIKDIVSMQQSYARVAGVRETVYVQDLVEDAFQMNQEALQRHQISVIRDFAPVPQVSIDKHKVLQILVNLIRNAKYACNEAGRPDRQIKVQITPGDTHFQIIVADNGIGIPAENLDRIFNHGFTTRKDGHGFGLHSAALAAKELGGHLHVESKGVGKGATFILELPLQNPATDPFPDDASQPVRT